MDRMRRARRTLLVAILAGGLFVTNQAAAGEWSDATLHEVTFERTGQGEQGETLLLVDEGKVYRLANDAQVTDSSGRAVASEDLSPPARVRFVASNGMIVQLKVIERLPR